MKRGLQAVTVSAALSFIALCVVVMRSYCRYWLLRQTGADDYLVIAALAFSILLTVCLGLQQHFGLGQHFDTLHAAEFTTMSKWFWISILMYHLGLVSVKSSVIIQLLRFILHSRLRLLCWCVLGLICSYGVAIGIVAIFSCQPVMYFWNKVMQGSCINLLAFWYFCAAFNIITDIVVLAIPMSVLPGLHLPKRQKFCLLAVFALGGFGCITSVLRLHSIYIVAKSTDVTWDNVGAATWSSAEVNTAIICACLPTLKPLIKALSPRLLGSYSHTTQVRNQPVLQSYKAFESWGVAERRHPLNDSASSTTTAPYFQKV